MSKKAWHVTGDDSPLVALIRQIEVGSYPPPPEILSALLSAWKQYLAAEGSLSLEDVLIGKPKRKAGNYSKRWSADGRNAWIGIAVEALMFRDGLTQEEAAAKLIKKCSLGLEVETVVKIARENYLSIAPKRKPRRPAK